LKPPKVISGKPSIQVFVQIVPACTLRAKSRQVWTFSLHTPADSP
jgi:hypothetical protein